MRPRGLIAVIGAVAAGLLLATAGAGVAMKLDRSSSVVRIAPVHVDFDKVKIKRATRAAVPRFVGIQNRAALRRAVNKFLRGKGISPAGFVIQRGKWNYAGPKCPGRVWNCTNARKVVQIFTAGSLARAGVRSLHDDNDNGGSQKFVCKPQSPGTNASTRTCVIIQVAPGPAKTNQFAECRIHDTNSPKTQTCNITQTNNTQGNNLAIIDMRITDTNGAVQNGTQDADLKQSTLGSGNNLAYVNLSLDFETNQVTASREQHQDGHLSLILDQDVLPIALTGTPASGNNAAYVKQSQDFDETALVNNAKQFQDTERVEDPCSDPQDPFAANCVDFHQQTDTTGKNWIELEQRLEFQQVARRPLTSQQTIGCGDKFCGNEEIGEQFDNQSGTSTGFSKADKDSVGLFTQLPFNVASAMQLLDPRIGSPHVQCCGEDSVLTLEQLGRGRGGPTADQGHINDASEFSTGTVDTRSEIRLQAGAAVRQSIVTCHADPGVGGGDGCVYEQECPQMTGPCTPSGAIPPTTTATILLNSFRKGD